MFVCTNNGILNMVVGIGGARITSSFASVVTVPFGESVQLWCDGVGPQLLTYTGLKDLFASETASKED